MPRARSHQPASLESQCIEAYMRYLYEEVNFVMHVRYFEDKSALLQRTGLSSQAMLQALDVQLACSLRGILHDIVRQKMVDLVVANLHGVVMSDRAKEGSISLLMQQQQQPQLPPPPPLSAAGEQHGRAAGVAGGGGVQHQNAVPSSSSSSSSSLLSSPGGFSRRALTSPPPFGSQGRLPLLAQLVSPPYCLPCRQLPVMQLLELVTGGGGDAASGGGGDTAFSPIRKLDLGSNKQWSSSQADPERLAELARTLWKVVGERCRSLETLVIPKELSYSSTLNSAVRGNGASLTHLTLKRNVPNNMFLSVVGASCPNLRELDIAGAEVVTDFGVVCLLFADPEQIFIESWNREKTVRRDQTKHRRETKRN